ncbi:nitrate- and nitrite sensing domain-containing protein [Rheinheimera sp.]|uniref:nitrate regulatory protein n=1 Tax=Rheinheimera sp. TaxID=1869214 RepID=UPI00307F3FA4
MISSDTFQFLLAAKRAEIKVLHQLAANCQLVTFVSELVHQLQRERGMSNVYLASGSELFRAERQAQLVHVTQQEQLLRQALQQHYLHKPEAHNSSRLLSAVSMALLGMDDLAELRQQISQQKISALASTQAFSRLIHAWQTLVSEAADIASDADICRLLVALQHLMQCKELAGQERAWGSIGFAKGSFSVDLIQRLTDLELAQFQAAEQFVSAAPAALAQSWIAQENTQGSQDLAHLRGMLKQFTGHDCTVPAIADIWYQLATDRMDHMQQLQVQLTTQLQQQAQHKLADARQQLDLYQQKVTARQQHNKAQIRSILFDPSMPGLYGDASAIQCRLEQTGYSSLYQLLNDQAAYINRIQAELAEVKAKADEQHLLKRAKIWLMQQQKLTEPAAHKLLQQQAMNQNCTAVDIARQLLQKTRQKVGD